MGCGTIITIVILDACILVYLSIFKFPLWGEWAFGDREVLPGSEFVFMMIFVGSLLIAASILTGWGILIREVFLGKRHSGQKPSTSERDISGLMLVIPGFGLCGISAIILVLAWIAGLMGMVPPVHWGRVPVPQMSADLARVYLDLPHEVPTSLWGRYFGQDNREGAGCIRDRNCLPQLVCRPIMQGTPWIRSTSRCLPPGGSNDLCLNPEDCQDHLTCLGESLSSGKPGFCTFRVRPGGVCFQKDDCEAGLRCNMYGKCEAVE